MRKQRVLTGPEGQGGYYHCISRVVGEAWLLNEECKEVLRSQMWKLIEYCGLRLITFALMSNHIHLLVYVPERTPVSDLELMRLYRNYYGEGTAQRKNELLLIEDSLRNGEEEGLKWRKRQLSQMFNLSIFNKLLKMRFTIWYNHRHKRSGTFWSSRYKSLVVEPGRHLQEVAAYIDLNPVRARIVSSPADYRFCGYAEAVHGKVSAMNGLGLLYGEDTDTAVRIHREALSRRVATEAPPDSSVDSSMDLAIDCGQLRTPLRVRGGVRVRYFSDAVALGSAEFVRKVAMLLPGSTKRNPRPLWVGNAGTPMYILDRLHKQGKAAV